MRRTTLAFLAMSAVVGAAHAQQPPKAKAPPASQPQSAKPSAADSTKCIGVISAIGDTLFLRKIGVTIFGNEENTAPIDAWRIDDFVAGKVGAFLGKSWTVRRVTYPKGAFASLDGQHPLFYNANDDLREIVQRVDVVDQVQPLYPGGEEQQRLRQYQSVDLWIGSR